MNHTTSQPMPRPDPDRLDMVLASLTTLQAQMHELQEIVSGTLKPSYTVQELSRLVGRSSYTVRRWVSEGRIQAIRVTGTGPKGRLLVPRVELEKLLASGQVSRKEEIPTDA